MSKAQLKPIFTDFGLYNCVCQSCVPRLCTMLQILELSICQIGRIVRRSVRQAFIHLTVSLQDVMTYSLEGWLSDVLSGWLLSQQLGWLLSDELSVLISDRLSDRLLQAAKGLSAGCQIGCQASHKAVYKTACTSAS